MYVQGKIKRIWDWPALGLVGCNLDKVYEDSDALKLLIQEICSVCQGYGDFDKIVSPESGGFVLGGPVALEFGKPLIPMRRTERLPYDYIESENEIMLADELESKDKHLGIHEDSIQNGESFIYIGPVFGSGKTAEAGIELPTRLGGECKGVYSAVFKHTRYPKGPDSREVLDLTGRNVLDFTFNNMDLEIVARSNNYIHVL